MDEARALKRSVDL